MSFVDFLLARLDEIEAAAAAERAHPGMNEYDDDDTYNSPARVLADVEAKRRIVERFAQGKAEWAAACEDYSDWAAGTPSRAGRATTSVSRDGLNELARVLRLLALSYADHPDYDEVWRP